jgi:hypothetical protein
MRSSLYEVRIERLAVHRSLLIGYAADLPFLPIKLEHGEWKRRWQLLAAAGSVQEDAAAFQPLLADYSVLRAASSITFATARGCDRNGTWLDLTSVTCALAR